MNVTKIDSRTVKTYIVTVEDGEVRPQPYSRVGARYRVARIVITKSDGNVRTVEFHGPVIKKDGTDGLNQASEKFHSGTKKPEWLSGIIGGLA